MSRLFMKRHPKGKSLHSRYVVLGTILAPPSSDVQILDAPHPAASSRLPEDDGTVDIPSAPGMSGEDTEGVIPQNRPTRGLLPEWDAFGLHDQLMRALCYQSFTKPTPIQLKALPPALQGRDVVGVAETVRSYLVPLHTNTDISVGIGENASLWIAYLTQAPLAEEPSGIEGPQTGARVDPSSYS